MIAKCSSGRIPAFSASAPRPIAATVPLLYPACINGMRVRPKARSAPAPLTFIATSAVAKLNP